MSGEAPCYSVIRRKQTAKQLQSAGSCKSCLVPFVILHEAQEFDFHIKKENLYPATARESSTSLRTTTTNKTMRILSGIQPSGVLHIGNYFGMMKPAIALQNEGEALYFIADYHALTSLHDPEALRENSRRVALDFLACGLNPKKASLFLQSDVPPVTELAWILSTVTPVSRLELAHSYKDKVARGVAPSAGLFNYPVLQAADILIYDSDVVPVGKDQKQHIEIARDLATRFNETFGTAGPRKLTPKAFASGAAFPTDAGKAQADILKLPESRIHAHTEVVPGLDGQKMSKSYGNTIDLFGDEKETRKRVMSIVTDSTPVETPKNPERSTIVQLYALFAPAAEVEEIRQRFRAGGTGYGEFKKQLFEKLWEYFAPMRRRREEILADPSYIDEALARGKKRANEIADSVMTRVRSAVGLG